MLSPEDVSISEAERLKELYALELLDTAYEKEYDDIVQLAAAPVMATAKGTNAANPCQPAFSATIISAGTTM